MCSFFYETEGISFSSLMLLVLLATLDIGYSE